MTKEQKIKIILQIIHEIQSKIDSGGYNELDQTEIEFLHKELLNHVTNI